MTQSPFTITRKSRSLLIPTFSTITFIDPKEINYIQAMQNYCMLYKHDGSHIFSSISFGKTLEKLELYGFFQCHKSYAINMHHILKYHKKGIVELTNRIEIPVARRRKEEFFAEMFDNSLAAHQ